ncbi:1-deoxy-D-xylulose-5-phosphate reductoisomerase [Pleionea sediminis]|uniref:1-deoxy-D-xylulose-5-phosphate reductoisomerase n=1 Tax=Pleionea sediminis TaxID=2569479 RepID=UPI001FEBBB44|nr:1-deoxy-D-xylulose-5-phosphate reductoisomerase [Pleionea sediminis]
MQQVTVLGSTGSIGVNTLDVIIRHPDKYQVFALSAHTNAEKLIEQIELIKPAFAVLVKTDNPSEIVQRVSSVSSKTEVLFGEDALKLIASHENVDTVMAAIVGAAGLIPTLSAALAGKKILLANKEALVVAGDLFMNAVKHNGAQLLPIDSEHNAIFQCLPHNYSERGFESSGVHKILLTGSGGPFRELPLNEFDSVTPEQACAHPNWDMGKKISVDSATMMNKGFEVIEACHLFQISTDQLEVVLHPQSIIHSMVSYSDGSVIAQMGQPDMRTPIAYGLSWPERIDAGVEPLDFSVVTQLGFEKPDATRYPCLKLAFEAFDEGGSMPAVLNAANEIAVASFLAGDCRFTDICRINEQVMSRIGRQHCASVDELLEQDLKARELAANIVSISGLG